jgi:DNA-binding GntR family transcriptional regulator
VGGGEKSAKSMRASPVEKSLASSEEVFKAIRDRIHSGRLVPGQRLIEAELVGELRTNRSRLREAFRRLQAEGLIKIDRNKGASVRRVSRQEMIDTLEVLGAVARVMVNKAVDNHENPGARRALQQALEHTRSFRSTLAATHQVRHFMEENERFWDVFDAIQANPVLSETRRRLETALVRLSAAGLMTTGKKGWIMRHEGLLVAVLRGDRSGSRKLVEQFIRDVHEAILALPAESFAW